MNFKRTIVFGCILTAVLWGFPASSADKDVDPAVQQFMETLAEHYKNIDSLSADFIQTRKTKLLKEPAETRGRILFSKPDHFLFQFTSPYKIKIFYEENKIVKLDEKEKSWSELSVRKHKENIMNFANVAESFDFLSKYFYVEKINTRLNSHYIVFIPKKRRMKKRVKLVEIWINKDTLIFERIKVEEPDDAVTDLKFNNVKRDISLNPETFNYDTKDFKKVKWQN